MKPMVDKIIKSITKYCRIWFITAKISLARVMATKAASSMFLLGKIIRFALFIYFIAVLTQGQKSLLGYSGKELLVFYLVFNFFDSLGQIFFRGIYWFRQQIISGEFDFRLTKPASPLFQVLTRETDLLDIPLLLVTGIWALTESAIGGMGQVIALILAITASLNLTIAIHIAVAAFGIITSEIDHLMWVYRDVSSMARFPVDIYNEAARVLLTFIAPVGIIYTFPAKGLLNLLTLEAASLGLLWSSLFLIGSSIYWRYALKQYSSASS